MKKKAIIIFSNILLGLIVIFSVSKSFGIYNVLNSSSNNVNVAKFSVNDNFTDSLSLEIDDLYPGTYTEHNFSVSNSNDGVVSEVNLKYKFEITKGGVLPLTFQLFDISNNSSVDLICSDNVCSTSYINMTFSSSKIKNYRLRVIFPETDYSSNAYSDYYADISDSLLLRIYNGQA